MYICQIINTRKVNWHENIPMRRIIHKQHCVQLVKCYDRQEVRSLMRMVISGGERLSDTLYCRDIRRIQKKR